MNKDKIIFFASGEFPSKTFEALASHFSVNDFCVEISALVTTKKQSRLFKNTIYENRYPDMIKTAKRYNIPVIFWEDGEEIVYQRCKEIQPDILCVISFKKLSERFLELPYKTAFNVHTSMLPFLRGAAPINHALRLGFKRTGLTAFVLNSKIDCGNILDTISIDIEKEDDFGSLYDNMSDICVGFTNTVINNLVSSEWETYLRYAKPQSIPFDSNIFRAPKLDSHYTEEWFIKGTQSLNLLRSVTPVDGLRFTFKICSNDNSEKHFSGKITKAKLIDRPYNDDILYETKSNFITDRKTYLYIKIKGPLSLNWIKVTEIQLDGKKRMNIEDFLRGFAVWLDDSKHVISLLDKKL